MTMMQKCLYGILGFFVGLFLGAVAFVTIWRRTIWAFVSIVDEVEIDSDPEYDLGDESSISPELSKTIKTAKADAGGHGLGQPKEVRSCVTLH